MRTIPLIEILIVVIGFFTVVVGGQTLQFAADYIQVRNTNPFSSSSEILRRVQIIREYDNVKPVNDTAWMDVR